MKHTRETFIKLVKEYRAAQKPLYLKGIDLSGLDLQGVNLQFVQMPEANLQGVNLQEDNLQGADLRGANLRWANMQEANLRCADLDFAGYELSCRTIGIKADKRLVSQLLYHLCRMDVSNCPEWDELRNDERVIALANQSHIIGEYDLPEIKQVNALEVKF